MLHWAVIENGIRGYMFPPLGHWMDIGMCVTQHAHTPPEQPRQAADLRGLVGSVLGYDCGIGCLFQLGIFYVMAYFRPLSESVPYVQIGV